MGFITTLYFHILFITLMGDESKMFEVKNEWKSSSHVTCVTSVFWSLFVNNKKITVTQLTKEVKSLLILNECDTSEYTDSDDLEEDAEINKIENETLKLRVNLKIK